jgi:hypothetical protein
MIYMVDHVYTDPETEAEWHAWYSAYLHKLVAVPGIHTAQRFKVIDAMPSRYLAMYSIDSLDVYSSDAYRRMGGGGSQSARFHQAYGLWTRNVFEGAARAPLLDAGQRIVVWDSDEPVIKGGAPPGTVVLKTVGLHMTTPYRAFAVLVDGTSCDLPGSRLYEPFTAPVPAGTHQESR